jgi:hypothetical protein
MLECLRALTLCLHKLDNSRRAALTALKRFQADLWRKSQRYLTAHQKGGRSKFAVAGAGQQQSLGALKQLFPDLCYERK